MRMLSALLLTLGLAACNSSNSTPRPAAATATAPAELPQVTVYKSASCGCCKAWVRHMEQNGFKVTAVDTEDLQTVKQQHGIAPALASCHTALVGGYVVEGHIPADDVKRLLAERPAVVGLAVPGMPIGSPGMEVGARKDPYAVLAVEKGGATRVFAQH